MPEKQEKKEKQSFSPVLDAILNGGSSVSMNFIEISKHAAKEKCLFRSSILNGCVVFKFPNFQEEVSAELKKAFGGPTAVEYHPVETGLYFPYSLDAPQDGGCAIYLRQKNYLQVLSDYLGASIDTIESNEDLAHDLKLLSLLDTVPSLDPFLLKECFEASGVPFDSSIFRLDPAEELEIRRLISDKISPIIEKAFEAGNKDLANRDRLLAALWDPTLPEAKNFVRAFGIAESEATPVFTAWKGITFYQLQVRVISPKLKEVLAWLKSNNANPIDAKANKAFMPQLQMYNVKIQTLINETIADMRSILQRYESCFGTFIAGNPTELTNFLRSARRVYYVLGYCISAINSAIAIFSREIHPPHKVHLTFDEVNNLYTRLDTTLSRKRDVPAAF